MNLELHLVLHLVVTGVALVLISKLLRGIEIRNWLAALVAAAVIGVTHYFMTPLAEWTGRKVAETIAAGVSLPVRIVLIVVPMLVINTLVLRLAATFSPGFKISDFATAVIAAVLLLLANWGLGEAMALFA